MLTNSRIEGVNVAMWITGAIVVGGRKGIHKNTIINYFIYMSSVSCIT